MTKARDVERELMQYFAAVGAPAGRVFSIRDFNTQVMMNAYTGGDRAALQQALLALVRDDIIIAMSSTEYTLTAKGLLLVAELWQARRPRALASPSAS